MKKYFLILISLSLVIITSCEDSDKNPLVQGDVAPFVKYESTNSVFDLSDPESRFSGTFFSERPELIESHEIFVAVNDGNTSPRFESVTITNTLPFEFNITIQEIEEILELAPGTILPGDTVLFNNVTTSVSGVTVAVEDVTVNGETSSVAQQQGYNLSGSVSCPFVYDDIPEGIYDVVLLDFAGFFTETLTTRTVELGPGDNQVTIVEGEYPVEGSDPLILTLDLETGNIIAVNEDGQAFGDGPVSAANGFGRNDYRLGPDTGVILSCVGSFSISLNFSVLNGNPHSFVLRAQ